MHTILDGLVTHTTNLCCNNVGCSSWKITSDENSSCSKILADLVTTIDFYLADLNKSQDNNQKQAKNLLKILKNAKYSKHSFYDYVTSSDAVENTTFNTFLKMNISFDKNKEKINVNFKYKKYSNRFQIIKRSSYFHESKNSYNLLQDLVIWIEEEYKAL